MSSFALPSQQIGDLTITAVSDGYLHASFDFLANIDPVDAARMQENAGITDHTSIHINCYLVRGGGRTILIDAGAGGFKQWGGRLTTNLLLAGIHPSEIYAILLTHAHPDHVGGLMDASGEAVFPNAELVVHHREVAFWEDDGNLSRAPERARGNFLVARQAFEGYRDRLRTFGAGEVFPGLTAVPLPGHTAGHTGYRLDSGDKSLLVWGDIVHFPQIQVPRPEVSIAFDQDAHFAAETRSRLLDLVSSDRLPVAGMHLGELGFAHIKRDGENYGVAYEE
ncbi:MBL fold metallo-hydrolase [Agrobacterium tumefaciens]|uniref:MBL fold metallo-hydrolase n=1 Tax=Agrobacterium tumefaciens TaxID=358 RepID=A0AAP9J672_AGRTU|nr:MBL fold metallo-hydrolase [Agrobacterium tumefaciens]NSZ58430.1 MBL fold metallo-hydrolase [Agrobacterium tumefaciens]QDY94509.1 MBL fold metallo-hydrolase [Agrobacterium tumefaciens]UXS49632.1 MBL fold metallo-hydrolase [Agrobacterium tumefaciens]UXS70887.1 MBL fold metallo-hydrolase [Agrobacterium tumefaciens]UXS78550.1 MBL fold metallo-hydrolase [Agrobacterium tumefaciens]